MQPGRLPLAALLAANAVSLLGNVMAAVAIPWLVLETTGSAALTGLAAFFATAPLAVGAVFGGAVADRIGPRAASVLADVTSAVAVAGIPLLHFADRLELWHVLALAFAGALFDSPGEAARQALVPELAGRAGVSLERANSLYAAAEHAGYLLGAPLAGVLIALIGAPAVLLVDAATFGVSALLVAAGIPSVRAELPAASYLRDVVEGLRFLGSDPVLLAFLLVPAAGNLLISPLAPVLLPVYAREVLGSAALLGVLIAAYGAGGLVGAAAVGALGRRLPRRRLWVGVWIAYPLAFAALVALPPPAVLGALLFAVGLTAGALAPLEHTVRQERTPLALRGRVLSTVKAALTLVVPVGVLGTGLLVEALGLRAAHGVLAAGNLVLALAALRLRVARRLDPP